MQKIFFISIFGALGVLSRYGLDQALSKWNENFPLSTFLINIFGCFLAGSLAAYTATRDFPPSLQTALIVGFCGGFTTFSAYALQTILMIEKEKWIPAMIYFLISPTVGLFAAFIPFWFLKKGA